MATTKYSVTLPNGKTATFHQGHIKAGNWHGYVYVAKHRVYGTVAINEAGQLDAPFTPSGSHAHLVSPAAVTEAEEPITVSIPDTVEQTDDERYQLSDAVN